MNWDWLMPVVAIAGLAVIKDELTLTPADRDHGVDRLDTCLKRFVNRLTCHNARSLKLERATAFDVCDFTETIDRLAERVDDAAEVALAHGY